MKTDKNDATTTIYKVGGIDYILIINPSETATDNLKDKVEKLIVKELKQRYFVVEEVK